MGWTEQQLRETAFALGRSGELWGDAFAAVRVAYGLPLDSPMWLVVEARWADGREAA